MKHVVAFEIYGPMLKAISSPTSTSIFSSNLLILLLKIDRKYSADVTALKAGFSIGRLFFHFSAKNLEITMKK